MPDDSAGNNSLPPGYLAVTGQTVLASQHNPPLEDLSASMTRRYMRDGRAPMLGNIPMNGYRATGAADAEGQQDYVTLAQLEAAIAAVSIAAPGIMQPYTISSSAAPAGYLFANGQAVSRTTYAALWAAVSGGNNLAATEGAKTAGQYGPGDGSTTFTLPNVYADNGYFIRPISSGRTIGTVQADELKSHGHTASFTGTPVPDHTHLGIGPSGAGNTFGNGNTASNPAATSAAGGHTPAGTVTVNSTGGTETRPKNIAFPVIIKT